MKFSAYTGITIRAGIHQLKFASGSKVILMLTEWQNVKLSGWGAHRSLQLMREKIKQNMATAQ